MSEAATLARVRAEIDALPPLRETVAAGELSARRSLGQHFIFDLNLTERIARAARLPGAYVDAPLVGETVVEIGPGPGGLTRSLLKAGARVVAVEKDARASDILTPLVEAAEGRLTVAVADALSTDLSALAPPGALICANLPYNIATPLIVGWLTTSPWPPWWRAATVMVQKEVAARLVAPPGTADYGRLGVLAGVRAHASAMFDVSPSAFVPPPKVWSTVVRLEPRPEAADVPIGELGRVTAAAFGQRRKMLRSSLKALTDDPEALIASAGLSPTERAERLSLEDFVALARRRAEGQARA
jgi:16S rRNA (adenine1518-N6/adenine1519-N6)-dimethyltransferase